MNQHKYAATRPKALILGAGRSGLGAALLLKSKDINCLISDIKSASPQTIATCKKHGIEIKIGPQTEDLLALRPMVICSPGIPQDIQILEKARSMGLVIKSEIDLALGNLGQDWIGVTGTNGKSTCTHWLAQLLTHAGHKSIAVGNIGMPPSEVLATSDRPGTFVVELSSYQIDSSFELQPHIVIFTSFSKDHLERHKTIRNYFLAKWKLVETLAEDGLLVTNQSVYKAALSFGCQLPKCKIILTYTEDETQTQIDLDKGNYVILTKSELQFYQNGKPTSLPNPFAYTHLSQNAAMSLVAAQHLTGKPIADLSKGFASLSPLPYRFEIIGTFSTHPIINDSKSTNVDSTLVAMKSLGKKTYLIIGGRKKLESFKPLLDFKKDILRLYIYGESKDDIADELSELNPLKCDNLSELLLLLKQDSNHQPASILFSPACASFDQFENFEARGLYFNKQIKQIFEVEDQSSADST